MYNYTAYLKTFLERCEYPQEAVEALLHNYDEIRENQKAAVLFHSMTELFERDLLFDYLGALKNLERVSAVSGISIMSVHLLFVLCLSRHTKELYDARGIDEDIYWMSMMDMRQKGFECKKRFNIWGSANGSWFDRFFQLTRFALGRLQFEPHFAEHNFQKGSHSIEIGDIVLNIHIPSGEPLRKEACLDSFRRAEQFFRELFPGKAVAFMCDSWLLYPEHVNILPEKSNIRMFMDFFDIVDSRTDDGSDLWRIFYVETCEELAKLPQETSLQRAYVRLLQAGKPTGSGIGYFFMENGRII